MGIIRIFRLIAICSVILYAGSIHAQSWTETGITETGDTITYRFPPPDSTFVHNRLVLKFYNGGLYTDSLCYDCEGIRSKGKHLFGEDNTFTDCKQTLMTQQFTLGIIVDPTIRGILSAFGASYIMRMTASNPCTDTLSVTRRGDTIPADDYNWVEVTFADTTGLIPAIEALATLNPASLQLADLVHLMQPMSPPPLRNPHDSEYVAGRQESLKMIGMPQAWGYNVGSSQIKVAVVDNGVDWRRCELGESAPEVNSKVSGGWDFNTSTVDGIDSVSPGMSQTHGTGCASIIAAFTNNSSCAGHLAAHFAWGMAGIAGGWGTFDDDTSTGGTGAQILAYKIDSIPTRFGYYYSDWAMSAILEASDSSPNGPYGYGAHVINNSYGYSKSDTNEVWGNDVFPGLRAAAAEAYRNNVCFVAAKGNSTESTDKLHIWPADFNPQKDVIAVGAAQFDYSREAYSSFGITSDLIAPGGTTIECGCPDTIVRAQSYSFTMDSFVYVNGTSSAAPHVSGVLALMRGFYSGTVIPFTEDWEGILEASVMSLQGRIDTAFGIYGLGFDTLTGWGFLRADSALEKLDPTGVDHYQLFHYSVPFASCDTSAWEDSSTFILEDDGFNGSLKAGPYPAFRREITSSKNYSLSIDTTKQVYTWGNGGDGVGLGGWSIASPNSQEPWSEVTNGLGGITGSPVNIREGIWHQQSRTVTAHSFQYKLLVHGSYVLYPPDSLCGVSFTVYGSAGGSSGVASTAASNESGMSIFPAMADQSAQVLTSASSRPSELDIVNFLGVIVNRQKVLAETSEITINTAELPEGFYFCRLISGEGTETAKFLVRH